MKYSKPTDLNRKAQRAWLTGSLALTLCSGAVIGQGTYAQAQDSSTNSVETMYFPHSQFKIPFNVDARGTQPTQVQLWVSTDQGASWQMQGTATSSQKHFEFRAAAEGLYLFSVQTLDENGRAFPSPKPPMRILIDTTKPQVALRSDVNASGQVVVDVRINEEHLKTDSVKLRYRTDQDTQWQEVTVTNIVAAGQIYEGQVILDLKNCREVGFVVTVADEAANVGEASTQYVMPRTAAAPQDIKLASQRNGGNETTSQRGIAPTPGAVAWPPQATAVTQPVTNSTASTSANSGATSKATLGAPARGVLAPANSASNAPKNATQNGGWVVSGQLASDGGLSLNPPQSLGPNAPTMPLNIANSPASTLEIPGALPQVSEELPAPRPEGNLPTKPIQPHFVDKQPSPADATPARVNANQPSQVQPQDPLANRATQNLGTFESDIDRSPVGQAFHCNSRSFSLDYSLNAAAGSALADVELWGTEDGGSTWQKWGSDPDRQSPFDVQVANDGLFGFRMVIVSQNGKVSNRPKNGDSADAWINVDTAKPNAKITRAVYGDGHEAGMLVIDYSCTDDNLHDRPISLSYSETQSGPWVTVASGLKNTGIYLWKADSNLPENIFLRLESVDKAGNVGVHTLDLPINVQGLSPRGRIQGFRPIANPE
ncbi:MAG: hypothetical protein SFV81_12140 [Pirellulaceae bacterium]|nr:hypothetical protein [Pirellulaceae bacterium]